MAQFIGGTDLQQKINIRLVLPGDTLELCAMNLEFNGCKRTAAEVAACLASGEELVAVALVLGQAAGFACAQRYRSFCYSACQGEITELYVCPAFRRRGIAQSLIAHLEDRLRQAGVEEMKILTNEKNDGALRLYEKCGYRRKSETVLQKDLPKHGPVNI
jgi:ribosomal protein S18 acetylase RimI-like enzyme